MSDLLTPEELDLIEEGFHAGTEIGRELAHRLIVSLRAAWAERDALRDAAPVPTGWVPRHGDDLPIWSMAATTERSAWLRLICSGDDTPSVEDLRSQGWRVVPCAALTGEEVTG